ncbi:MAG: hypothetical protein ACLFTK_05940 [Anaerolineales bacterium]
MTQARVYHIERFYFGNFIQNERAAGKPTILARSAGVTPQVSQGALRLVRVRPPELTEADMPSSLGLFYGDQVGYFVLKSQRVPQGYAQLVFMFVPDMAMRWLGGNYAHFEALGYQDMKAFAAPQHDLPPLTLDDPHSFTDNEQIDFLYDLFYYCGDQIKNVEALVSALIHQRRLAILNAPHVLEQRMRFIHGLLCMLPAPARVGITWVTHVDNIDDTPAQLNFVDTVAGIQEKDVVYDWDAGTLLTPIDTDKYSKFIAAQLRLDASLVVEATNEIARTAVWRAMRQESLPQALHFASRRAAIDSAVRSNQPADRDIVAAILRQDPTLSNEMRMQYAQHLLAFTLALSDEALAPADVLPVVATADRPLAESIYRQLRTEAEGNHPLRVIDIIERWMTHVPQAHVIPWNQLAYIAALTHLNSLLTAGDTEATIAFLTRIQRASRDLHMETVVPQIIQTTQDAAAYDPDLAMAIFLLVAEYLPIEGFQEFVADPQIVGQLPQHLQHALFYLQPQQRGAAPRHLLISVASELEAQHRMLVVGRLAELAVHLEREDLIDTRILEGLLRASRSGYAWRFAQLINYLAERYSQPEMLQQLEVGALEMLPHLYFSSQRYEQGVRLLEHYQQDVYGTANLGAFVESMGHIFLDANLPVEAIEQIFTHIEHSKLRPEARARALAAVLIAGDWSLAYRKLARRLTIMLYNDEALVEVIKLENALALLEYHLQARDSVSILEIITVVLNVALGMGQRGVDLIVQVWGRIKKTPDVSDVALDLLREYVRRCDPKIAPHVPAYLGRQIGREVGAILQATYLMRLVMNGRDMLRFASDLTMTVDLLSDFAATYHPQKEPPLKHVLRRSLNSLTGGLSDDDRLMIGKSMARIAELCFGMAHQPDRKRKAESITAELLNLRRVPETGPDMLIYLGGYFNRRQAHQHDLYREGIQHVFGNRSAIVIREELPIVRAFLEDIQRAFPPDAAPPDVNLQSLNDEIDNLWTALSLYNQRQTTETMAKNTQFLAYLIAEIGGRARERAFRNANLVNGEQMPENEIESMIWISGYFHRKHKP